MVYILLSTTPFVDGSIRTAIYDLQRKKIFFIPSSLSKLLKKNSGKISYSDLITKNAYYSKLLKYYEKYLIENEVIYYTDFPNEFKKINLNWQNPSEITNSIISIAKLSLSSSNLKSLFSKLDLFNCKAVELRIEHKFDLKEFQKIFTYINNSKILSLNLILKNNWYEINFLKQVLCFSSKIENISIYNSKESEVIYLNINNFPILINYKCGYIEDFEKHPLITLKNLNVNAYIESIKYNLYFNKKLFIDAEGDIRFPNNNSKWKNIFEVKIEDFKEINSFTKLWYINKNLIDICKNCEFRYLCIDPRIPIQRLNNSWFYSSECDYNPYLAKWKSDNGYQTLSECGIDVDEETFYENKAKIKKIQNELWQ